MTQNAKFKREVRARMAQTGEKYTEAARAVRAAQGGATDRAPSITQKRIERLRRLVEEVGNAQAAGLIDDEGDPELIELVELIHALDDSGALVDPEAGS